MRDERNLSQNDFPPGTNNIFWFCLLSGMTEITIDSYFSLGISSYDAHRKFGEH